MAYIAHETVFSYEKDSTIPMAPLPLTVMMKQVVGRSSVQAIRLSGKTLSVLLAGRVLASLVNWTPWLREFIPLYLEISLREMAFLVFPVAASGDFLQATLTYSLLYPIDFSKISQDDTKGLLDALTIKEGSLSMTVNSTSSSLSTTTNRDSRYWVRAYENFMTQLRRQVLPSSSSPSLALPQLSMLAGNGWKDFFQLLIVSQAQCDLNRLIRTQPHRRKQIFEEREWYRLVSVELETIAIVTVQLQEIITYLCSPTQEEKTSIQEKSVLSSVHVTSQAPSTNKNESVKPTLLVPDIYLQPTEKKVEVKDPLQESLHKFLSSKESQAALRYAVLLKDKFQDFGEHLWATIAELPKRGELAGVEEAGSQPKIPGRSTQHLLRHVLEPLLAQRTMLAVENLSLLLNAALQEDLLGVTLSSVSVVLVALLRLEQTLASFVHLLQQCYAARVSAQGKVIYIRYKVRSAHYLPSEVVGVQRAVREGIALITQSYHDVLNDHTLPSDLRISQGRQSNTKRWRQPL
eukprot:scaffold3227_cov188-Ochromonas_danica.AAC.10